MTMTITDGPLEVRGGNYRLVFPADRPFAHLVTAQNKTIAELFYLSSINNLDGEDDTTGIGTWLVERQPDQVVLSLHTSSSVWREKIYHIRCFEHRLEFEIEVHGNAPVTSIRYFGGNYSGNLRWGTGFFWSGQQFKCGFNPEPDSSEIYNFDAACGSKIDLSGVPLPGRADWFFTPPPFCFAFDTGAEWLGIGVQATPGQNQYTCLRYHGMRGAFYLSLAFDGQLSVTGSIRLPAIGFDFGVDAYAALGRHVNTLRTLSLAPIAAKKTIPAWWQGPIFCGWGAQCHLAKLQNGRAPDYARQDAYQSFMATLDQHNLHPGIVVIHDKWQATYGGNTVDVDKWPDLPGFIRSRHDRGQKVLLWLKAWDPEGLPAHECICNSAGLPVALDPTQPDCASRLRSAVQRMLSNDGSGADGFKIDFTARIPSGPGICSHSGAWGLELMRAYLEVIAREAKKVKPDALVITHTPNPYLADLVDMIRLNDINTGTDVVRQMTHRARIARIACPDALIDTDNWPMPNLAAWRAYLPVQPTLGVPALYIDQAIDSTGESLEEQDYEQLRAIWQARRWVEPGSSG